MQDNGEKQIETAVKTFREGRGTVNKDNRKNARDSRWTGSGVHEGDVTGSIPRIGSKIQH